MQSKFLLAIILLSVYACHSGKKMADSGPSKITHEESDGRLKVKLSGVEIVGHQVAMAPLPEGVDPAYSRNGFIHPLATPSGKVLTRIQPADHWHHYGIWNPWTHVEIEGDTVDFWNLNSKQGTVLFENFQKKENKGKGFVYEAVHNHYKLKPSKQAVLKEVQTITVQPINDTTYTLDFDSEMECTTSSPFNILEYRYAGLGWRCTEEWYKDNSMVLTSKNIPRTGSDGTRATWMIVQGSLGDGYGGVVMMSHPSNFNHIAGDGEPIRIWPDNSNRRGDMFANFSPTKVMDWKLLPGQKYQLKYRLLVYDGKMDFAGAEAAYKQYLKDVKS